jgi:hypothetical protein
LTVSERPADELRGAGPVAAVVDTLHARAARDPETGRFVPGNTAAVRSGDRSEQLWEALQPARRDLVEGLKVSLGLGDDAPETVLGLLEAYAEARLLRQAMFHQMTRLGGPITAKGKCRAVMTAYYAAHDREVKLATSLGLDRRGRNVTPASPSAFLETVSKERSA